MTEQPTYEEAIRRTNLFEPLALFDPHVVGTLPLGDAWPDRDIDIDIVCCAAVRSVIAAMLWVRLREANDSAIDQRSAKGRPVAARFDACGCLFEIFAS